MTHNQQILIGRLSERERKQEGWLLQCRTLVAQSEDFMIFKFNKISEMFNQFKKQK